MKIDLKQFKFMHKNLRILLVHLEDNTGLEFNATSMFRIDDDGVHGTLPLRGFDIRMRDFNVGKAIEKFINRHWLYDIERASMTCALIHGKGFRQHLHIQVHDNTVLRNTVGKK